ncbi:NADPH:quinone oxidoreductase [Marinobacter sp. Z-F4-2]|nr:NADPH:quinone oxidoreductase [Marinobacter sp. Z-F4-2]
MRAVWVKEIGPIESVEVLETDIPEPGPGEVLIRVGAAGINFPDILVIEGKYQVRPPVPFSPGKELAGRIERLGDGVIDLKIGDRVAALVEYGAYAEYAVVPADGCFRLPDNIPYTDAAALGLSYQTAYFALIERASFKAGDRVLINGAAGGVGLAALQLVKALGGVAFAGVINDEQARVAREYGADHIINLSDKPIRDRLREQVRDATNGGGVDIVLDPVGGEVFEASLRALNWSGRLVVIGFAAGELPTVRANYLLVKNIAVLGLQWSDYRDRSPEKVSAAQRHMYELYQVSKLKPHAELIEPLSEFKSLLNMVKDGKVHGKAVIEISSVD